MSRIHNLVYDTQQRDLDLETSSKPTEVNILQERIEYLEWEISSLRDELLATRLEYNKELLK
jgi:hypothetical protein